MLEQDAIKLYYQKFPLIVDYPVRIADHYYLIIKRDGILFHNNSVVTFCHILDPEKYKELTIKSMRKVFPKYQQIVGKGFCLSFRSITVEEFRTCLEQS